MDMARYRVRSLADVMGSGCREPEIQGIHRKDTLMERSAGCENEQIVYVGGVRGDVGLAVHDLEDLAEIVPRQVRIGHRERAGRRAFTYLTQCSADHVDRGATVGAAHIGHRELAPIVWDIHRLQCALNLRHRAIDDDLRSGRRQRVITAALHTDIAGSLALIVHAIPRNA